MKLPLIIVKLLQELNKPRKVALTQKIFFVQQLGVMLKAGISLAAALKTLEQQTTSKGFGVILADLHQGVEKGNLLSVSLEKYQKIFGDLFINMVKAGEASGKLEEVLKQLFVQMKKDHDIIAKVKGAMIYPMIVLIMMLAIGILMIVYVIPTITSVFNEINIDLPLPTRVLMATSGFVLAYGVYLLIIVAVVLVALNRLISLPYGKRIYHQLLLNLPVAGKIMKKINLARFCRTLSSLLKTDIPIVQSFEITAKILGNVVYKEAMLEAKEKIKKGICIEESLRPHIGLFPPVVLQMISVGEETGALDNILEESALFYEEEVNQTMESLPSLIEPILMVVLGVAVGGMAVAVILPMYSLSQAM